MFDFVYTLASANIDLSEPNLVTIYITNRSRMNSIMGIIGQDHLEVFALGSRKKNAEFDFVCTLTSTNINQSAPNLLKLYLTIRSRMTLIGI